jgi:hypothetical protein
VLAVVDRELWRISWYAICVVCFVAAWRSGSIGRWFVGAAAGLATLAVLPVLTDHGVRRVRLAATAWTAVSGAVVTMLLSAIAQGSSDPTGLAGAVFIGLLLAAAAGWIADERIARAADREREAQRALAQQRHDELRAAVNGVPARVAMHRFRLVAPWLLAASLLGRRRR